MAPRIYVADPLAQGMSLALPAPAARHVQVLRKQPGDELTLFNGQGGEWSACVEQMGRREVTVRIGEFNALTRESPLSITLAVGMPANERFDWLVEKATELGAARIQPLMTERSVLRLSGERAQRKQEHWQSVAIAASEQSGRTVVPTVEAPMTLSAWLPQSLTEAASGWVLSPIATQPWTVAGADSTRSVVLLSGPEGGLSAEEETLAAARGFRPISLGPRILRAETAPLALLAALTVGV